MYGDLQKLWVIYGTNGANLIFPVHTLVKTMSENVIEMLPAVHALTGQSYWH